MYQQPTAIEGVTPCGLPAYTPVQIPWLVPKDFDFEFHQQWGHGILTGTWSNLTLTTDPSPISPTLGLVLTLDSLSKPYPCQVRTSIWSMSSQSTTHCPRSRCVMSCGTG